MAEVPVMRAATPAAGLLCIVTILAAAVSAPSSQRGTEPDLEGRWVGTLQVSGGSLQVILHLRRTSEGWTGSLDSPDQGATGIPLDGVSVEGSQIRVELGRGAAIFSATLDTARGVLTGQWSQGGVVLPLTLRRSEEPLRRARPQEPTLPRPYVSREDIVTTGGDGDGVRLACTLVLPDAQVASPAALLLSGSGPQDRDEAAFGHRPFLVLADHLAHNGIATMRCDDRGIGGSSGNFWGSTTLEFARDASAVLRVLQAADSVDPNRVGVIGHSEGGVVAAMVAAEDPSVAFVVTLAAPGTTGAELLIERQVLAARRNGAPPALVDRLVRLQRDSYELVRRSQDSSTVAAEIEALLAQGLADLSSEQLRQIGVETADARAAARQTAQLMATPWFRFFLDYDPADAFARIESPVLALMGALDRQVPPEDGLAAVVRALEGNGNDSSSVLVVPGVNHLFQHAETGDPSEYAEIEETMALEVLQRISDWIHGVAGSTQ